VGLQIREERPDDHESIRSAVSTAFASPDHGRLVDAIRASSWYVAAWSLVAVIDEEVVGHVMVSFANLRDDGSDRSVANLSPLAVHPARQRRGVGSALMRAVIPVVDAAGEPLIVLEGDPSYYSRFGFEHAAPLGIRMRLPEWAPPEAGQALRLSRYDAAIRGEVVYPEAFDLVSHR
jgi:putative acetyltransferase